jgi:hypothetical protein
VCDSGAFGWILLPLESRVKTFPSSPTKDSLPHGQAEVPAPQPAVCWVAHLHCE